MTELTGMTCAEITEWVKTQGYPAFRGKQIFRWIHQGAEFGEMTNLSKEMRENLEQTAIVQPVHVRLKRESPLDGTVKLLYELRDGNCVEGVLMRYKYGVSLCISTQVGCRMGCRFCASTLEGRVRDLTAGEMLGEILCANRLLEEEDIRVSHVVLMGSGEPLDNYGNVVRFLRLMKEEEGIQLSLRNISLSTCGIVPKMYDLAEEGLPVTLCVSLHAPTDEIRRQTMPIANTWSIAEILEACRNYIRKTGRRVIFEYALSDGLNAEKEHAEQLSRLLRGMQCHVNLIPLNVVRERDMKGIDEKKVQEFLKVLQDNHISATRRREMGDDIEGACGQLRRKVITGE
ncbi:MAG: 23S rRNA (adenine(2503)-C(2))-methyltransferase RlmN [Clostridia bacterium]|jgi:23S rRNA (adenine2503-C2)-methyltransferase|nr:23S rRNA (adenine(2503)-C(2))-methyltransferase RlmN [Clostridia bacterium]